MTAPAPAGGAARPNQERKQRVERPGTNRQLWAFIGAYFDLWLPHRVFTPGHSSPFAFVADAFFHPGQDLAAWASRSGGKTLGASVIAALEFLYHDRLQGRVLSGSEDQAKFLYQYWQTWCNGVLSSRLDGPVNRLLTNVAGGRLEILAASQKRVRGPKVQRLFEDELDEIEPEIDTAAVGMIDSAPGMPGRTIYTSTWHRPDGLMGRLIDACPDNGVRLHRWNLWESIERCPPDRHDNGAGCEHCPLAPACLAKAREVFADPRRAVGIAAEGGGIYRIDDAVKAFRKLGAAAWRAEYLCKRPSVEGLVYPEFDPDAHRDERPPAGLAVYRAIDWGLNVFVCLWLGVDKLGRVYLLDTYRAEQGTLRQHADFILAHRLKAVRATYCDPAGRNRNDQTGRSNVEQFARWGMPCTYTSSARLRDVHNGIQMVRAMLKSASGDRRFFYVPSDNNRTFVRAMQSYCNRRVNGVWIDEPADPQEHEHIPDALRYFAVNRQADRAVAVVGYGTG